MRRTTTKLLVAGGALTLLGGAAQALTGAGGPVEATVPIVRAAVPDGAAERLAGAVRIRTVAPEDTESIDASAFADFHAYLRAAFPRAHAELLRETVATHSLLYTWRGSDASLEPILLAGHIDVVPVEAGREEAWTRDPFGGRIADGFVWGRGAIDNKSTVVGALEAVEMLLGEGFRPARTVYIAYGHDEETGGAGGAARIAALLRSRGVELEMVLDEGGVVGDGLLPGVPDPVALVGIAEKGFVSVELGVRAAGGHSSLPPRGSAAGILGAAVARLEEDQMPARLEEPTLQLFDRIAPRLPVLQRALLANIWLTRGVVTRRLEQAPATNAMVRTTTAVTMLKAGTKDNVIPSEATAVVNFRILPGDSVAAVVDHVERAIGDERVAVRVVGRFSSEPSATSSADSRAFRTLERAIRSVNPDVVVAPYLVVVATDARHYADLSPNVLRFLPLRLTARDLDRVHGIDERIGVREYEAAVLTYRQLVVEAAAG
jgi:carboxypeptidase PM20D1